ncbi:MAG: lipopolysaccharide heptosyltransferase II [Candidatus Aenigmatarchaeota archaeon]
MKALIFNPFGIGDVLFTTPLIRNLKENIKDISIYYICNRRTHPLLKNNIFLKKIFIFEKDEWREIFKKSKLKFFTKSLSFFLSLYKEEFDIVFDFSLNSQYGAFLKLLGIKTRIGFNFHNRGRFLTHKINIPKGFIDKPVANYYLELLKFLNIRPKEYPFELFIPEVILERSKNFLKENIGSKGLLIGICPGSGDSWGDNAYFKRWPQENFLNLCKLLISQLKVKLILLGSKSEDSICKYIYDNLEEKPLNLCGKTNLEEFCALVSLCSFLITNDGGAFHIAQALNKPTVVFFGPVSEKVYGSYPKNRKNFIFTSTIPCRPCYKEFKFRGCNFDKECLRRISVEEVFFTIKNWLDNF